MNMGTDQSEKFELDGYTYTVHHPNANKLTKIAFWFFEAGGPTFANIYISLASGKTPDETEVPLADLFSHAFKVINEERREFILEFLAKHCEVDDKPLKTIYDEHFRGKFMHHKKWIIKSLKVMFGDFSLGSLQNLS